MNIDEAQSKVNDIKRALEAAEEELRQARAEAYRRVTSRPCPECGHLIGLNGMPNKQGETDSHSVECPNCERSWDVAITWNGGPALEPVNYALKWTWRGWSFKNEPVGKLTNDQLQDLKDYYQDLGDGATVVQKQHYQTLIMEQVRRMDARRLDEIRDTNMSILEILKNKFKGE
jgi:predicted RNA-binding Zn-ribbon protein involved in translation (DUF1610 family)